MSENYRQFGRSEFQAGHPSFSDIVQKGISEYLQIPAINPRPACEVIRAPDGSLLSIRITEGVRFQEGTLRSLLIELTRIAANPQELFSVVDASNSDAVAEKVREYRAAGVLGQNELGAANKIIADRIVEVALRSDEELEQTLENIFERLLDGRPIRRTITHTEHALKRAAEVRNQAPTSDTGQDEQFARMLRFAQTLEEAELLKDFHDRQSLLGTFPIIQIPQFAELLLRRLTRQGVDVESGQEAKNIWMAKSIIKDLLARYAQDPGRHSANVAAITRRLYPQPMRSDSLSREGLVRTANEITQAKNRTAAADQQLPMLDPAENGVMAEALRRVLEVTTANDASGEEYHRQRLEDQLYAQLVGMLLEQRNYKQ